MVSIEPNLLSYTDGEAWRDIYGHHVAIKTGQDSQIMKIGNLPKPSYAVRSNLNGDYDIVSPDCNLVGDFWTALDWTSWYSLTCLVKQATDECED